MYSLYKLFNVLRLTVAYRFNGRRMLLDKLAYDAACNRRQALHLTRNILVLFLKSRRKQQVMHY